MPQSNIPDHQPFGSFNRREETPKGGFLSPCWAGPKRSISKSEIFPPLLPTESSTKETLTVIKSIKPRIDITITGYRQVGKTTLAALIKQALSEKGFSDVQIHCHPKMPISPEDVLKEATRKGYDPKRVAVHINDLDDYKVPEFTEGPAFEHSLPPTKKKFKG